MRKCNGEQDIESLGDPIHLFPPVSLFLSPTAQWEPHSLLHPKTEGGRLCPKETEIPPPPQPSACRRQGRAGWEVRG